MLLLNRKIMGKKLFRLDDGMFINQLHLKMWPKIKKFAFAGSRTRVYCLEGNYPNRWTTNADGDCLHFLIKSEK